MSDRNILEETYADIRADLEHKVRVKARVEPDELRGFFALVLHLEEQLEASKRQADVDSLCIHGRDATIHALTEELAEAKALSEELDALALAIRAIDDGDIPPGAIRWQEDRWLELQKQTEAILARLTKKDDHE